MKIEIPERGDILVCDFSPTLGHEQKGIRPALVLSSSEFNSKSNLVLICPITSTERGYFFEVKINTEKTKGVILAQQIKTIDFKIRHIKIVDKVDIITLKEVIDKVCILIGQQ
ncbi:MAG: type II toxin-antitoxin system PemK/MazF family toxin [Candidatus Paceibacterota bacterium]|jgi:mRNA interferase MazF